jgi:hypothetical protein
LESIRYRETRRRRKSCGFVKNKPKPLRRAGVGEGKERAVTDGLGEECGKKGRCAFPQPTRPGAGVENHKTDGMTGVWGVRRGVEEPGEREERRKRGGRGRSADGVKDLFNGFRDLEVFLLERVDLADGM